MMLDIGELTVNLSGWRFVGWTGFLLTSGLVADYLHRSWSKIPIAFAVFMVGLCLVHLSFAGHQFFWWRNEDMVVAGHCNDLLSPNFSAAICDMQRYWASYNIYVTPWSYVVASFGFGMMIMPLLRMAYSVTWSAAAALSVSWLAVAYGVGIFAALR